MNSVQLVNEMKFFEERLLRAFEDMLRTQAADPRWLAIGRTHIEQGFMAVHRALDPLDRVALPEDLKL